MRRRKGRECREGKGEMGEFSYSRVGEAEEGGAHVVRYGGR